MGQLDAPPVHDRLTTSQQSSPPLALTRMRGQHIALAALRPWLPESDVLARLREEVGLLSQLVADQNRLLRDIADHVGRRLDSLERAIEARAAPPSPPIDRFESRSQLREGIARRTGLGRGLEALIPPRREASLDPFDGH